MSKIEDQYEDYLYLMRIAYPNSTKRFLAKQSVTHIIVDDLKSFKSLDTFLRGSLMKSLIKQILKGKRELPDKENDDFNIKKEVLDERILSTYSN